MATSQLIIEKLKIPRDFALTTDLQSMHYYNQAFNAQKASRT
jgi:hypothetical protein